MAKTELYKPEYCAIAYNLCSLGFKDEKLAEVFGVSPGTIYNWKRYHPEFAACVSRGKEIVDGEVASALLKRALGYEYPSIHISAYKGQVTRTPITKHVPPDVTACMFWLANRQPELFKKNPTVDTNGEVPPMNITITSKPAVGDIRVTHGSDGDSD